MTATETRPRSTRPAARAARASPRCVRSPNEPSTAATLLWTETTGASEQRRRHAPYAAYSSSTRTGRCGESYGPPESTRPAACRTSPTRADSAGLEQRGGRAERDRLRVRHPTPNCARHALGVECGRRDEALPAGLRARRSRTAGQDDRSAVRLRGRRRAGSGAHDVRALRHRLAEVRHRPLADAHLRLRPARAPDGVGVEQGPEDHQDLLAVGDAEDKTR